VSGEIDQRIGEEIGGVPIGFFDLLAAPDHPFRSQVFVRMEPVESAAGYAVELVEAAFLRRPALAEAQVPFAEHACGITALLEELTEQHLVDAEAAGEVLSYWQRAGQAVPERVSSRQQRAAIGGADRRRPVEAGAAHPGGGQ
jgi:hypothetical protein